MSTFANVYVGSAPNDLTGDPLRNAFQKINTNFANIQAGGTSGVLSVAGRSGNVVLSVNDVVGAASIAYVNTSVAYTMGNYQNWSSNVATVSSALDQLAARLKAAGF